MSYRWYLVQTIASREFVADINLRQQSFTTFLPRTLKTVRHARKIRTVPAAYFPGYLFVSLDLEWDSWRAINGTFGAVRIVTSAGRPLCAPQGLVEALRTTADEAGIVAPLPDLKVGDHVRLLSGPFADQIGKIHHLSGPERVSVLLDIMNGSVPVQVERSILLPT